MPDAKDGMAFMLAVEALLVKTPGGKHELNFDRLRELVREHGDFTVAAARSYSHNAGISKGFGQLALGLAAAYEAEFGDDSLTRAVKRDLAALGLGTIAFDVKAMDLPTLPESGKIITLQIDEASVKTGDSFLLVRILSPHLAAANVKPIALRGRVIITFPYDNDPREVWQIPEVRRFVADLLTRIPYFAYYLHPDRTLGMVSVVYGSLADPSAWKDGGLDLAHTSVVDAVLRGLLETVKAAPLLGDTEEGAATQVLAPFPAEYAEWILTQVRS